jgi:ankyrin repeat protein
MSNDENVVATTGPDGPRQAKKQQQYNVMTSEREFLTRLFETALQGSFAAFKSVVEGYIRQHRADTTSRGRDHRHNENSLTVVDVLTQFRDAKKRTAMHFACQASSNGENEDGESGHDDIVIQLLTSNWIQPRSALATMLRMKDADGLIPLMLLVQQQPTLGQRRAELRIRTMLQVDAEIVPSIATSTAKLSKLGLIRSHVGGTALHYAAANLDGTTSQILQALLAPEAGGAVALRTFSKQGGTPLHWCVGGSGKNEVNALEIIRTLVEAGADVNAHQTDPAVVPPPLVVALAANHDAYGKTLLQAALASQQSIDPTLYYVLPHDQKTNVFHMAADMNSVGTLSILLQIWSNKLEDIGTLAQNPLQSVNGQGLVPIEIAARERHVGCVLLFLPYLDDPHVLPEAQHDGLEKVWTEADAQLFIARFHSHGGVGKFQQQELLSSGVTGSSSSGTKEEKQAPTSTNGDAGELDPIILQSKRIEEEALKEAAKLLAAMEGREPPNAGAEEAAARLKEQGNAHFAAKEYQKAIESYTEAIEMIPGEATYYSNRSACYMQLQLPLEALHDAVMVRQLRPTWSKGAFRLAVARLALQRYEDAAVAAFEGLKMDDQNDELKSLLQKCVKKGRQDYHQTTNRSKR